MTRTLEENDTKKSSVRRYSLCVIGFILFITLVVILSPVWVYVSQTNLVEKNAWLFFGIRVTGYVALGFYLQKVALRQTKESTKKRIVRFLLQLVVIYEVIFGLNLIGKIVGYLV